jgi:hypothetical protein
MLRQRTSATETVFIRSRIRHGTIDSSSCSAHGSKPPWCASLRNRRSTRSVKTEPVF